MKENRFTRNDGIQLIGRQNQNLKSQRQTFDDSKCRIWFLNTFRNSNVCVLTSKCVKLNKQFRLIGWTYLSVGGQFVCFVSFFGNPIATISHQSSKMSRRKQARPIRHLDDEDGGGGGPDGVASLLDGQEDEASTTHTGAGKFLSNFPSRSQKLTVPSAEG